MSFLIALLLAAAGLAAAGPALAETSYRLLELDGKLLKWGGEILGQGATVTYAVASSRLDSPQARNCGAIAPPQDGLAQSGVTKAQFDSELEAAFSAWSQVAGIDFKRIQDQTRADIVIGAQVLPRGTAFTNVAYHTQNGPVAMLTRSLICFNPEWRWKIGFGGDAEAYDLRYVLTHEIGHAIGLDHAGPAGQIMGFRYGEAFRTPRGGDMDGVAALYGPRQLPLVREARPVPALPSGRTPAALAIQPNLGLNATPENAETPENSP